MRIWSIIILVCASLFANARDNKLYYCENDFNIDVKYSKDFPVATYSIGLNLFLLDGDAYITVFAGITEDVILNYRNKENIVVDSLKKELLIKIKNYDYDVVSINTEQMKRLRNIQNDEEYGGIYYSYEWNDKIIKYNGYFCYRHWEEIIDADTRLFLSGNNYFDSKTNKSIGIDEIFSVDGMNLMLRYMTADFSEWIRQYVDNSTYLDFLGCMKQKHFIFDKSIIEDIDCNEDGITIYSIGAGDYLGAEVLVWYIDEELCDNSDNNKCNICPIKSHLLLCKACNYEVTFSAKDCLSFFLPDSPMYKYYFNNLKH